MDPKNSTIKSAKPSGPWQSFSKIFPATLTAKSPDAGHGHGLQSLSGWWYSWPTPLKNDGLKVSWDNDYSQLNAGHGKIAGHSPKQRLFSCYITCLFVGMIPLMNFAWPSPIRHCWLIRGPTTKIVIVYMNSRLQIGTIWLVNWRFVNPGLTSLPNKVGRVIPSTWLSSSACDLTVERVDTAVAG